MKILDVPQSGKAGTLVGYQTRYGQIRRRYVVPCDPCTSIQVLRRRAMGRARFLWRTLTDEQRVAWNVAAHNRHTRPHLNKSGPLTGYLLFVKINCNLAAISLPMVLDSPAEPRFEASPVVKLIATNTNGQIALKLSVSRKPANPIILLGTRPRSQGVSYVDHFTILGVLPDPVRGASDITDLFLGKYPTLRAGMRVFIRTVQQVNGWQDLPTQVSAIVPAA